MEYRLHSGYALSLCLVHSALMHFCDFLLIIMQLVYFLNCYLVVVVLLYCCVVVILCYKDNLSCRQAGKQADRQFKLFDRMLVGCWLVDWLLRAHILSFPSILFCSLHVCM